ncbi:hypothetical protein [Demequina sp. NBRC 110055]|uniref:hypothetical protein n=1 Tax=Demequina sp. NBRC 110055 TaxID=1570344 RepID=UPI000A0587D7|nr:hypothetical protein [Demequina sp. NBRC 110055]
MEGPLIESAWAGSAIMVGLVVLGIAIWVAVAIAFFSMANNVAKMRRELEDVYAILRVQTDIIHEQTRRAPGQPGNPDSE